VLTVVGRPWPVVVAFTFIEGRLKSAQVQYPRKVNLATGEMSPPLKKDGEALHAALYGAMTAAHGAPASETSSARGAKPLKYLASWAGPVGGVQLEFSSTSWPNGWATLTFFTPEWL